MIGYDEARQLTAATLRDASATVLEAHSYGYDAAGNRNQVRDGSAAPTNYDVNNLNQLLAARDHGKTTFSGYVDEPASVKLNGKPATVMSTDGGAPFKFEGIVDLDAGSNTVVVEAKDGQNNVGTKTFAVSTTGNSTTYEYDANGNLRYSKQPNGTVIREYRWDQQNRLVRELEGTHESVYEYDGASRRTRIKELTSSVETKNETFVWCGGRICQKRASNGSTVVRSYFGNGFQESGPTNYFYTRDHLGSVREVVGSDGTTVASRLSYDLWGKVAETGSGALSDFTYTGHHYDRPTGLNLAQYRGYDAGLGRWLSRDPAGLRGGLNLYGYSNDDPVNYIDPDGRWVWAAVAVVATVVAYGYTFAADDAAAQREAHPEAANSFWAGLALSAGVLAPVSALGDVAALGPEAAQAAGACGGGTAALSDRARELNAAIGPRAAGSQRQLLDLFFKGQIGADAVKTETFEAYAEIARITIETKGDRLGEQARRLELINDALSGR